MWKWLVATALAAATIVSSQSGPALASQATYDQAYRVVKHQPNVKYFDAFSYQWIKFSGDPAPGLVSDVHKFLSSMFRPFLHPSAERAASLSRNAPWWFQHQVILVPGCRNDYICVKQDIMYGNDGIAGSITDVRARAWSLQTGRPASLASFVSQSDLSVFTKQAKRAIRKSYCFYGLGIDLPPSYESFPDWAPVEGGIRLWYHEYKFGCQATDAFVPWVK